MIDLFIGVQHQR